MEHLLGLTAFALVAVLTLFWSRRYPALAWVLTVALLFRVAAALFHFYIAPLPDGTADAVSFERRAWGLVTGGSILEEFRGPDTYFYSLVLAVLYAATDRSPLMAQALSVLVGIGCVLTAWLLARDLWGERAARKAAWVVALFPALVQYSALTLREVFVVFFFLLGVLAAVRWSRHGKTGAAVGAASAFAAATFFHGGMAVAFLVFAALFVARAMRTLAFSLLRGRLHFFSLVFVLGGFLAAGWYLTSDMRLPKLGSAAQAVSTERWLQHMSGTTRDSAGYPAWTTPRTSMDLVWAIPARSVYFVFSPFPWDVRSPWHLVGLADALLYLGLVWLVWRNRQSILAEPGARTVLLLLLPLIIVFAVGTGNFGTAVRHRAKFVPCIIVLAAPLIPRPVLERRPALTRECNDVPK